MSAANYIANNLKNSHLGVCFFAINRKPYLMCPIESNSCNIVPALVDKNALRIS